LAPPLTTLPRSEDRGTEYETGFNRVVELLAGHSANANASRQDLIDEAGVLVARERRHLLKNEREDASRETALFRVLVRMERGPSWLTGTASATPQTTGVKAGRPEFAHR
jgi:hypothetical protein